MSSCASFSMHLKIFFSPNPRINQKIPSTSCSNERSPSARAGKLTNREFTIHALFFPSKKLLSPSGLTSFVASAFFIKCLPRSCAHFWLFNGRMVETLKTGSSSLASSVWGSTCLMMWPMKFWAMMSLATSAKVTLEFGRSGSRSCWRESEPKFYLLIYLYSEIIVLFDGKPFELHGNFLVG